MEHDDQDDVVMFGGLECYEADGVTYWTLCYGGNLCYTGMFHSSGYGYSIGEYRRDWQVDTLEYFYLGYMW